MARVITFSTKFPSYHPKKGQPTFFVEKVLKSISEWRKIIEHQMMPTIVNDFALTLEEPKHHTIRAGNRWKVGDKFSPRVWSAKPYASPQITIAPDVEIKKLWDIKMFKSGDINIRLKTETGSISYWCSIDSPGFKKLAENDGLSVSDMVAWFKMPCTFKGQIICWNDSIQY